MAVVNVGTQNVKFYIDMVSIDMACYSASENTSTFTFVSSVASSTVVLDGANRVVTINGNEDYGVICKRTGKWPVLDGSMLFMGLAITPSNAVVSTKIEYTERYV